MNNAKHWPVRASLRDEASSGGLYYNLNRYYDADSGQYLSPDPIGFAGGLRPQGYVYNPMEWVDPLGLAETSHGAVEQAKSNSTEPTLPSNEVASGDGVKLSHKYRSGDHGPAHIHVEGGGKTTRIGPVGHPLNNQDSSMTKTQKKVYEKNKSKIRRALKKLVSGCYTMSCQIRRNHGKFYMGI